MNNPVVLFLAFFIFGGTGMLIGYKFGPGWAIIGGFVGIVLVLLGLMLDIGEGRY